ncbi:helix-turn-helix domain-containing protein [Bacillus paranthracis]|uniref:helix-turn-helix domain-containing protein n=1 Tax=Bacillus paranthracis TaxID=2026186 RepID=UPI0013D2029E|nr:helix-turn-helix domain-containing protein [Bacillus paranthracis]QRH07912.1 helix-turn-helix domain-containing protein [Bacillus paranthracis]
MSIEKKHCLVFVNEIIETREKYGLAQHEFSLLLGIGENTIARYERGTLPSAENSLLIRQAANPILMKKFIETNGNSINSSTREALLKGLQLEKEIEED